MKLYLSFFWLIFSCTLYTESTIRTIDVENLCFPADPNIEGDKLKKTFVCEGVNSVSQIIQNVPTGANGIIISNSKIYGNDFLILGVEKNFESLSSVQIIQSYIELGVLKWLESLKNLELLSLVGSTNSYTLSFDNVNMTSLDLNLNLFKSLKKLHISNGNISTLIVNDTENAPFLELPDNRFECGQDFLWLLGFYDVPSRVILNNSICFMKKITHGKNYPMIYSLRGKPLVSFLEYKRETVVNCPPKCTCELQGMLTVDRPQMNVQCINISMTDFPKVIPKGTTRCNFSYNMIEDLTPLYTNTIYESVGVIALSHNHISFLDPIKFPDLLRRRKDSGFWLDHNMLQKFPAQEIEKVYEEAVKERRFVQFLLGDNPYICSCDYIGPFQNFIYQHMYDIYDARNIHCSGDDPYNSDVMILVLDVGQLCSQEEAYLDTIDVINLVLAILLLIMTIDFIYNYRQYKKSRKLPWLVTFFKW